MNEQPPVLLQVQDPAAPTEPPRSFKLDWCPKHWAEFMYALQDRELGGKIAPNKEELHKKLAAGEQDPCYEGLMQINIAAMQFFTPKTMVENQKGCPICAFNDVIGHVANQMALKYAEPTEQH